MAQQLLNGWQQHRWAVQSIRCGIKERLGKGMTQIMQSQRRGKLCCLAELGNNFAEWQTLPEKLSFQSSQVSGRILTKTELLPAGFFTLLQVRT